MDSATATDMNHPRQIEKLDIVIVGAGLSGLAASIQCALAGHGVTVIESAKELAEIGAGLQLTPNATRLLQTWGVYPSLFVHAPCEPKVCTVYNYKGKILAHEDDYDKKCRQKYNAPFADCHRVELQQALVKKAMEHGVKVQLGKRVVRLNFDVEDEAQHEAGKMGSKRARIETDNGRSFTADLVVAADGLWSSCRSIMLNQADPPLPTGDLAYRIVLNVEDIHDKKLQKMVREPGLRFWIGPNAHVVAYSMWGGEMYNVVLLVPDDLGEGVSRTMGDTGEMRKLFEGWDPVLTELLSCVDKVDKWKLMHHEPLPTWVNSESNMVLIGDSCHPMLPYLAQGANVSIEDGAVLGLVLSPSVNPAFRTKQDLPNALQLFQRLRKARGEAVASETFKQRHDFHLPDGEEQEERDRVFAEWLGRSEELEKTTLEFPSRWTCPVKQKFLYGYDALEDVKEAVRGAVNERAKV